MQLCLCVTLLQACTAYPTLAYPTLLCRLTAQRQHSRCSTIKTATTTTKSVTKLPRLPHIDIAASLYPRPSGVHPRPFSDMTKLKHLHSHSVLLLYPILSNWHWELVESPRVEFRLGLHKITHIEKRKIIFY